jgi:hypothetical protein
MGGGKMMHLQSKYFCCVDACKNVTYKEILPRIACAGLVVEIGEG